MSNFLALFEREKTFKPKKTFVEGTIRYSLFKKAEASLKSGIDLKYAVCLPEGEDKNDWIAVHVVDFFNRLNLLYGLISEYCTQETCPKMNGGQKYEYFWMDGKNYKKPTSLPASNYIGCLIDWVEAQINNPTLFPPDIDTPFPKSFATSCKKILSRLYRIFVHVYIHHFDKIIAMGAEAHVNTCYKHYYYFVINFGMIEKKELIPLEDMTKRICT